MMLQDVINVISYVKLNIMNKLIDANDPGSFVSRPSYYLNAMTTFPTNSVGNAAGLRGCQYQGRLGQRPGTPSIPTQPPCGRSISTFLLCVGLLNAGTSLDSSHPPAGCLLGLYHPGLYMILYMCVCTMLYMITTFPVWLGFRGSERDASLSESVAAFIWAAFCGIVNYLYSIITDSFLPTFVQRPACPVGVK